MAFHRHVLDIKGHISKSKDERSEIMRALTEPKEPAYLEYYEAMWESLFRAEQENNDNLDNEWVVNFLDKVAAARNLPPYFYISGAQRNALMNKIRKHTEALEKIYTNQLFNQNLISNDGQFFHGFYNYEISEDANGEKIETKSRPKVSVVDALQFFAERAEDAINESAHRGKTGKNVEAVRFIRILGERNNERYGRPLNSVLQTAALAVYDVEYLESDISNLLNRCQNKVGIAV